MIEQVPSTLGEVHERCVPDLARIRMLAQQPTDGAPLPPGLGPELSATIQRVLWHLELAERLVIADSLRKRPVAVFLSRRLDRLTVAAEAVDSAVRGDDLPGLRRAVRTFDALAVAMWRVQLGVCHTHERGSSRPDRRD